MVLSPEQVRAFGDDGYVVVPNFKTPSQTAALRRRAEAIVEGFDPAQAAGIFTTRDESTKNDDYFLSSGDKVRCFFEEEAFDGSGRLRVPKARAINKIGHAMHDLDPAFAEFSHGDRLQSLAIELGLRDPRVYQSMYIFKQPEIGGEVRWHQDATYFYTEPLSVITLWFALERADRSNGCLWVQPGGHRTPLRERFTVEAGAGTLHKLDATPWPTLDRAKPLEVEDGTLVVFNALLPHYSAPNRSSSSRHAYTLHAVEGAAVYPASNWLQRGSGFPARPFA